MKLFRSIFMAVVLISPTLAWGASAPKINRDTMSVYEICNHESVSGTMKILCDYLENGAEKKLLDEEQKKAHMKCYATTCSIHLSDYYYMCFHTGIGFSCKAGSLVDDDASATSHVSANISDVAGTCTSAASGASASKTEATGKSKKSDDEEEPSVAFNEPSYSFGVDYTPEVIEVDDRRAAVRAYEDYLVKTFCKKDNGHVTISDGGSYQDKITVNCTGWKKDISKPRTAENEHAVALCHARCAGLGQAYESGNFIGTYTSSCKCQTTRAEKRAANQQARDERKAARAEDRAARQEKRADERAARQEERKKEKAVECDGRNPPMDIKQNDLGLWVCVDTDETIKKREEERKTNKTLDAFWNEMEDLERVFNKRVRQLQRQAKKDGGAK